MKLRAIRRRDCRHQALAPRRMRPWLLFAMVKWLEARFHLNEFAASRQPARRP
jgi:hypothetical protein